MFILVSKYFIPKGYKGLTVFPFIFLKSKNDLNNKEIINHEKIHIRQQVELLIFPFFVWYFVEFAFRFLVFRNWKEAYRNISFEREAYGNEANLDFLGKKKYASFIKYL